MSLEVFSQQIPTILKHYFDDQQRLTISKGMPYLKKFSRVHEWLQENGQHLVNISQATRAYTVLRTKLQKEQDKVTSETNIGLKANEEQQEVNQTQIQTNETFESSRSVLNTQLSKAQEQLRKASVVGFTHPIAKLVSKQVTRCIAVCGQHIENWRQWGIDRWGHWGQRVVELGAPLAATAVWSNAALAQTCSSLSLTGAAQCVSTVATPYFWVPAAVVYGMGWVCTKVYNKAKEMFTCQNEIDQLDSQITEKTAAHKEQQKTFEQRKKELAEQIQKSGQAVLSAQEQCKKLVSQKETVESVLGEIQAKILDKGTERAFSEVERIAAKKTGEADKIDDIAPHMMTIFEHTLCKFAFKPEVLQAIQSAPADDAIEEFPDEDSKEFDDGTGLGFPAVQSASGAPVVEPTDD